MGTDEDFLKQRNREIGAILAKARLLQRRTVTECAELLKTSRRRYNAMERGEVGISIAETELLLQYLDVPALYISPKIFASGTSSVVVEELPEEIVVRIKQHGAKSA